MMLLPHRWVLLVLLSACAAPLVAQTPDERAALDALRDSLAAVTDTAALKRLEALTIERAKRNRDDPFLHLQLGFLASRLGELTGSDRRYEDAAGEFAWAAELRPAWPYAWYGLGLAELAIGEHAVIAIENIRQQLGKDYLSKASRAFARAVQADPGFARGAIDLGNTALSQRIRPRLDAVREAVRLAAGGEGGGRIPEIQLVRGRVERELGEADSALAAFQAYLRAGGDSGLGLLELARTQYLARRAEGGREAYFAASRAITLPTALAQLRADLSWVATAAELAAFDSLDTPRARADWLEGFWERRDVADARDRGERLAEHYRRWFYARHNFRLVSRHRRYDITEVYRTEQRDFDDRGVIYLRHGEPDARATYGDTGVEPNLSWLYRRPDGDLVFHFVAREDVQDYKLVESLVDVLGFREAIHARGGAGPAVASLYASRGEFGGAYRRVGDGIGAAGRQLVEERQTGRRSIALGTATDSYRRRFALPLDVVKSDFVVGATPKDPQGQMLHVVFAIPAGRLAPVTHADGAFYQFQFRLLVTDRTDHVVGRLDTTRVFRSERTLGGSDYLAAWVSVPIPPGPHRYRLLVETPDGAAGELVTRDSFTVSALDGRSFAASDLVLGRRTVGLRWVIPGDTIFLNALGRYPERSTVELYYEVYGLAPGAPYRTEIRLEKEGGRSIVSAIGRLFGGGRAPVRLAFDAAAEGPSMRVRRALDLRDTPRGRYRLTLELSDPATGRTITRARSIEVVSTP